MTKTDTTAKQKLASMVNELEQVMTKHIDEMSDREVNHILDNYSEFLKLDMQRNFTNSRETRLKTSPFDDILADD